METQAEILELLSLHQASYNAERQALYLFTDFVSKHAGGQLFDRKNFTGHITASSFIINQQTDELLLLKHKFLDRWLQPGGHVDRTDTSLQAAALREAEEETGISAADLSPVVQTVFDFESHFIPANPGKQELSHYHHDARFLFAYSKDKSVNLSKEESTDGKWFSFAELANDADFGKIVEKIKMVKRG